MRKNKFLEEAVEVAKQSDCLRRQVGAVLVKNGKIIAEGFNREVRGVMPCAKVGCIREQKQIVSGTRAEECRGVCAEQNALIRCALKETSPKNSILYSTLYPCPVCARLLINAGIKRIVYKEARDNELTAELFKEAGVKTELG